VSNLALSKKKSGLPGVFSKYTRQRIIICRVFLELHSANLFFKKKSQHTIIVCRVFLRITLGKPIFQRKKIFFSQHICAPASQLKRKFNLIQT